MSVKAKFRCASVKDTGTQKQVELYPVHSGSEENKSFAKYTPGGTLNMTIDYETEAVNFFEPQKEYYLTFEKAED